jgi:Domain of unknown function (DUF4349)
MRHRQRIALAAPGLALVAIALLAGCSAASHSSSAAGTALPAQQAAGAPNAAAGSAPRSANAAGSAPGAVKPAGSGQAASAARIARSGEQLIYTAQLNVRAKNVQDAVTRATQIVTDAGGYVAAENSANDPAHPSQSTATIQLKIPVTAYAATLAQLDGGILGTQLSLQQQAQDVTQQATDVNSQVTSDRAAITQLRALLSHAGSVGDLLNVQNQINSEESDLESLEAQQNALDHETAFATVTVTVVGPAAVRALTMRKPSPPGLLSGLSGGWHAFRTAVDWLLAIAGAVAPFAVVAAIAFYVLYRVRRRVRPGP